MRTLVTIKGGKVSMDVLDGHGDACTKATEHYVNHLGYGYAPEQRFKPEYYGPGEGRERERQHE